MTEPIIKMLQSTNPEEISNYIKNYLPNDPVNLQRIYNQLLDFSTNFSQINQKPTFNRWNSLKNISYRKQTIQNEKNSKDKIKVISKDLKFSQSLIKIKRKLPNDCSLSSKNKILTYSDKNKQQYINGRFNMLARDLKDKGIRPNRQELSLGLQIAKQQEDKIAKPLQPNSKVIFNQKTEISDQIKRFNINQKFYKNDIDDVEIDQQKFYDRKMKAFLDRRRSTLTDILTHKNEIKDVNNKKFPGVKSKLFQRTEKFSKTDYKDLGINSFVKKLSQQSNKYDHLNAIESNNRQLNNQNQQKNHYKSEKLSQVNTLLEYCTKSLSKKAQIKSRFNIDNENLFQNTMRKLTQQVNLNHVNKIQAPKQGLQKEEASTQLMIKKVKQNFLKQYFQKYDQNYIRMVKNLQTQRTKKGILKNKKDLLRNELMFRKIMKSSSKQ